MKVQIKDYQAIKSADLDFVQGLNVIVGPTNNGKSSIIRAITAAINNQSGTDFINYDAIATTVTIENAGHTVKWSKSKKAGKSSYVIDGEELTKIGKQQLPEVAAVLNMPEITVADSRIRLNFWQQLDPPFLVDKTPYQLFDFISKSKEQEAIATLQQTTDEALKTLNDDINKLTITIDNKTKEISNYEQAVSKLQGVAEYDVDFLESAFGLYNSIKDSYTRFLEVQTQLVNTQDSVNKTTARYNGVVTVYTELLDLVSQRDKVVKAVKQYNTIADLAATSKGNLTKAASRIDSLEALSNKLAKTIEKLSSTQLQVDTINRLLGQLNDVKTKIKTCEEHILNIDSNIENLNIAISEFKVCPLCNSDLSGGHVHG